MQKIQECQAEIRSVVQQLVKSVVVDGPNTDQVFLVEGGLTILCGLCDNAIITHVVDVLNDDIAEKQIAQVSERALPRSLIAIPMQSTDSFCLEDVSENVTVVTTPPEDEVVAKIAEVVEEALPVVLLSDALDDTQGGSEERGGQH